MLKNDTLKNGTSHIGLYGNAPPPGLCVIWSLVFSASVKETQKNNTFHILILMRNIIVCKCNVSLTYSNIESLGFD